MLIEIIFNQSNYLNPGSLLPWRHRKWQCCNTW